MKTALALSFLIMQIICQQLPPFVGQPKFQIDNQIFPIPNNLEYPPTGAKLVDERTAQVSSAIDVFINANIKMCSTCESLKFFGIKMGSNNVSTLQYLTVSSACVGSLSFAVPSTSSGRPGNNQLFIAPLLGD